MSEKIEKIIVELNDPSENQASYIFTHAQWLHLQKLGWRGPVPNLELCRKHGDSKPLHLCLDGIYNLNDKPTEPIQHARTILPEVFPTAMIISISIAWFHDFRRLQLGDLEDMTTSSTQLEERLLNAYQALESSAK